MKIILKKIMLLVLQAAIIISLVSCNEDDSPFKTYKEYGLTYTLPKEMKVKNVEYADLCYFDGRAEVLISVFNRDLIGSADEGGLNLNPDISVDDYAERFIFWNDYDTEFEFDEKRNVATFFATPPEEYASNDEYYHVITRNHDYIYVVIMCCDSDIMDEYREKFIEWGNSVSVD